MVVRWCWTCVVVAVGLACLCWVVDSFSFLVDAVVVLSGAVEAEPQHMDSSWVLLVEVLAPHREPLAFVQLSVVLMDVQLVVVAAVRQHMGWLVEVSIPWQASLA